MSPNHYTETATMENADKATSPTSGNAIWGDTLNALSKMSLDKSNDAEIANSIAHLTTDQKTLVQQLRNLQGQHRILENEYEKEWIILKLKYLKQFKVLYEERRKHLVNNGSSEESQFSGTPKLPGFWLTSLKNHRLFASLIKDHDEPVLQYLEDISYEWLDDNEQSSYKIIFTFKTNPYFTNEKLVKTYKMEKVEDSNETVDLATEGTKIDWKPGRDVTRVTVKKKQRNLRTSQIRVVNDTVRVASFFDFFISIEMPPVEQLEQLSTSEARELDETIESDFDYGGLIRERIIPNAIGWYLGIEDDEWSDQSSLDNSDVSDDASNDSDTKKK